MALFWRNPSMELLGRELGTHWADFGSVEPNPNRTMPWSAIHSTADRGSSAFLLVFCVSQPFSGNRSVPEQLTLNQRVAGSSPAAPTNEINMMGKIRQK